MRAWESWKNVSSNLKSPGNLCLKKGTNPECLACSCLKFEWKVNACFLHNNIQYIKKKKIVDSDWLKALQLKCNASAKSATLVQITTKIFEWTRRTRTVSEGQPEVFRKLPNLTWRLLESAEDHPRIFEDLWRLPKRRLPKVIIRCFSFNLGLICTSVL